MILSPHEAQRFYDHFGKKQDAQAFYEDAALDDLITHAKFETAQSIYEFGCGTGRFAERILRNELPSSASYTGTDISQTMVLLAEQRLLLYKKRASVTKSGNVIHFEPAEHSVDRVVSSYVLDLLSDADIKNVLTEAHRVLKPGGKLCLVGLTNGVTVFSKLVSILWGMCFKIHAKLVGGCRPISLESYFDQSSWSLEYHHIVIQYGISSEVIIAMPNTPGNVIDPAVQIG